MNKEKYMKKLIVISAIFLGACASKPESVVFTPPFNQQNIPITNTTNIPAVAYVYETEVTAMGRTQVVEATRMCEDSGLRASPTFARRRITGQTSEVVVDIQCLPKYK
jgi:hypothetical protein